MTLIWSGLLFAQTPTYEINHKCGLEVNQFLRTYYQEGPAAASKAFGQNIEDPMVSLVLRCIDMEATVRQLQARGVEYNRISDGVLTVRVMPDRIEELANWSSVKKVSGFQKRQLHLDKARASTKVDAVHNGENLETPFTGKNVLIGLLDQGFQYTHAAFRVSDDSSRIAAVWNLAVSGRKQLRTQAEILGSGVDGTRESHGTHVAGIAAGGKLYGSKTYYGVAPDAQMVFIVSKNFDDADVLDGIKFVSDIASERNMPWIVNMSFGTNFSPHDGSSELSRDMDEMLAKKGVVVTSAGNDGGNVLHASSSFATGHTTSYVAVDEKSQTYIFLYVVGDGPEPFTVAPVLYNNVSNIYVTRSETFWKSKLTEEYGVDSVTNRYYYQLMLNASSTKRLSGLEDCTIAFQIDGAPGHYIHAFLNGNGPQFVAEKSRSATIDDMMSVGSPADTRSAVTVGSYVTKNKWTTLEGKTYGYVDASVVNALSSYSSFGPMVDSTLLKPDVCAPGQGLVSSIYKNSSEFVSDVSSIVEKVKMGITDYYYAIMQGTSMSAPMVSGIIALWLEANPALNEKQIHEIIAESSSRDYWTGTCWNPKWGYGKIDAYEGLKLALKKTGISAKRNVAEPVSIRKSGKMWKVLFNANETFADLLLCSLDGKTLVHRHLDGASVGSEQIFDFSALPAGLYVLKIQTPNSVSSRKVMVK